MPQASAKFTLKKCKRAAWPMHLIKREKQECTPQKGQPKRTANTVWSCHVACRQTNSTKLGGGESWLASSVRALTRSSLLSLTPFRLVPSASENERCLFLTCTDCAVCLRTTGAGPELLIGLLMASTNDCGMP